MKSSNLGADFGIFTSSCKEKQASTKNRGNLSHVSIGLQWVQGLGFDVSGGRAPGLYDLSFPCRTVIFCSKHPNPKPVQLLVGIAESTATCPTCLKRQAFVLFVYAWSSHTSHPKLT